MIKTHNPNFVDSIKEKLTRQFFMKLIGIELTKIEEGYIEAELDVAQIHKQQKGFLHGGVTATIADLVTGFAAVSLVPADNNVVTVEMKVSYLNPGVGEKVFAKGWVIKQGSKLFFCEGEIYDIRKGEKVLIAKASSTMAAISPNK